jgi:hypothetical protein
MNMMHIQNGTSRNGTSSKQDITKWHKLKMAHAQNGTRHKTTQAQDGTSTKHHKAQGTWHKTT